MLAWFPPRAVAMEVRFRTAQKQKRVPIAFQEVELLPVEFYRLQPGDLEVGKLELFFDPGELGPGHEVLHQLAREEAGAVGCNLALQVGVTFYTESGGIRDATFRCVRRTLQSKKKRR